MGRASPVPRITIGWIGTPFRFAISKAPSLKERAELCIKHVRLAIEHDGGKYALIGMRRHYAGYFRGLRGASQLRAELAGYKELEPLLARLEALRDTDPERIAALVGAHTEEAIRLCIVLRLASRLNRTRSPTPRPEIGVAVDDTAIHLTFPPGWLAERPLTLADLELEAQSLSVIGFELSWV